MRVREARRIEVEVTTNAEMTYLFRFRLCPAGFEQSEDERLFEGNCRLVRDSEESDIPYGPPYFCHNGHFKQWGAA